MIEEKHFRIEGKCWRKQRGGLIARPWGALTGHSYCSSITATTASLTWLRCYTFALRDEGGTHELVGHVAQADEIVFDFEGESVALMSVV
jgi:hypothetical protein